MRNLIGMLMFVMIPHAARADMGFPGISQVHLHLNVETERDLSGYRIYFVSPSACEPLEVAPGKPCRVSGEKQWQAGCLLAIPVGLIQMVEDKEFWNLVWKNKLPPEVIRSDWINFRQSLPFFDSRNELIDTYRVEVASGDKVRFVYVGRDSDNWWSKGGRFVAGIFLSVGIAWAGYRWIRQLRKRPVP